MLRARQGFWVIVSLLSVPALVDGQDSIVALMVLSIYALQSAALVWRRTNLPLMLALTVLGGLAQLLVVADVLPSDVAVCAAIYSAARWSPDRVVRGAALVLCGVCALGAALRWPLIGTWQGSLGYFGIVGVLLVGLWLLGDLVRRRALYRSRLDEQHAALLRDRDQRVALAAQLERTRTAREMHDVIAHGLTVVVVQADGAAYAAEHAETWERAQAAQALLTIAATARESLGETRRVLNVLRSEPGRDHRRCSPWCERVATHRNAFRDRRRDRPGPRGQPFGRRAHRRRPMAGLPPDVSRAAYRIVQEALTNVLKHSSPDAPTDVFVSRSASELCLRIETAGDAVTVSSRDHPVGNGLIGMRERATALGGTFTAAPQPTGGFLVAATLPLPVAVS